MTPERLEQIRAEVEKDRPTVSGWDARDLLAEVEMLLDLQEKIGRLHEPTVLFDLCSESGCDNPTCCESPHDGMFFHMDSPAGTVCLTCREDDGSPVDWPCETAALLESAEPNRSSQESTKEESTP